MRLFSWQQNDKIFTASILDYIAVLKEQAGYKFTALIQDRYETVLRDWFGEPVEFEEAERWAIINAIDLEQSGSREEAQRGMLQTLDLCQPYLSMNTHPSHLQRFKNIMEWVVSKTTHEREMVLADISTGENLLDWSEEGNNRYQAITPHGKAIIVEEKAVKSAYLVNPSSHYFAKIKHSSGAVYKSLETFLDFVDAEYWIQKTLRELDDPRISEFYLGNIHFTLNICKHSLPPDIDPVHITRLEYLEVILDEFLL